MRRKDLLSAINVCSAYYERTNGEGAWRLLTALAQLFYSLPSR